MSSNEIISIYNAELLNTIDNDCMIININATYKKGSGAEAIYTATKETWKMADWRPARYDYVLSEYRGLIREVFKVDEWYSKERPDKYGKMYMGYGFNGTVAEENVRHRYLNKSIKGIKPRGYGFPTIYPETLREWISNIQNE